MIIWNLNITTDTSFSYCSQKYCGIQQTLQTSFRYTKVYDITVPGKCTKQCVLETALMFMVNNICKLLELFVI